MQWIVLIIYSSTYTENMASTSKIFIQKGIVFGCMEDQEQHIKNVGEPQHRKLLTLKW